MIEYNRKTIDEVDSVFHILQGVDLRILSDVANFGCQNTLFDTEIEKAVGIALLITVTSTLRFVQADAIFDKSFLKNSERLVPMKSLYVDTMAHLKRIVKIDQDMAHYIFALALTDIEGSGLTVSRVVDASLNTCSLNELEQKLKQKPMYEYEIDNFVCYRNIIIHRL